MTPDPRRPPVVALLKWAVRRRNVDPLTGVVTVDERSAGLSDMDAAALEFALCFGERSECEVVAVSAGPPSSEGALRMALACGATRAIRVDASAGASSVEIASALSTALIDVGPAFVFAGVHGLDRASGSVPAFVADRLGAAQALGLVDVVTGADGDVEALRRVDGGGRERLRVNAPAILSVEGATATLRRAALRSSLAAEQASIEVMANTHSEGSGPIVAEQATRPFRPRTRSVPAPPGGTALDRIRVLTDSATARTPARTVTLDAAAAADAILGQLAEWGVGPRGDDAAR